MSEREKELERELAAARERIERLKADRNFWIFCYQVAEFQLKKQGGAHGKKS